MKSGDAMALLRKYGAKDSVIRHIQAVRDYAMEIARDVDCDLELVEAGALLHDIGRTRTHGIDHAVVGAEMLRNEGVDPRIVSIVERHVGAGLTEEEARYLGLPPKSYVPETIEEKIVCHADNLIGGKGRITIHEAIRTAREKWTPGATERLVRFHFEVFRPVEVALETCDEASLEKAIGELDALYRVRRGDGGCVVSAYGHDAKKAAARLKKLDKMGL
jgi:uncharacterized protein (TIGR00295 family)